MSKYSEVIDHNEEELELALEKNWSFQFCCICLLDYRIRAFVVRSQDVT